MIMSQEKAVVLEVNAFSDIEDAVERELAKAEKKPKNI
jgi:RNA polymerase nonessential primary-like sigma factor